MQNLGHDGIVDVGEEFSDGKGMCRPCFSATSIDRTGSSIESVGGGLPIDFFFVFLLVLGTMLIKTCKRAL